MRHLWFTFVSVCFWATVLPIILYANDSKLGEEVIRPPVDTYECMDDAEIIEWLDYMEAKPISMSPREIVADMNGTIHTYRRIFIEGLNPRDMWCHVETEAL